MYKGGKDAGQRLVQALLAEGVQGASQQQRPRIVVNAVTVGPVRHAVDRMLKQTRIVTHREKMREAHPRGKAT